MCMACTENEVVKRNVGVALRAVIRESGHRLTPHSRSDVQLITADDRPLADRFIVFINAANLSSPLLRHIPEQIHYDLHFI